MKQFAIVLALVLATCTAVRAQTPPADAAQPAPAAAAPAQLGSWWTVNAREIHPLPTRWLVHAEGQFSLSRTTGNVEGHTIAGSGLLAVRKRLVTNLTSVSSTINELAQGSEKFTQEIYNVTNLLLYNVVQRTNLAAGLLYERDDPKFVKHRTAVFAGVNQHLLVEPTHSLQVVGALGWENEQGTQPGFDENSPIAYFSQALTAQLGPRVGVRQGLELIFDLKHASDQRRNLSGSVDFRVATFLTISPTFTVRYDGRTTPLAKNTDTMTMVALRFSR